MSAAGSFAGWVTSGEEAGLVALPLRASGGLQLPLSPGQLVSCPGPQIPGKAPIWQMSVEFSRSPPGPGKVTVTHSPAISQHLLY